MIPFEVRLASDSVKEYARDIPTQPAVIFYGRRVTFKELNESSDRLATAVANMGYKKGDRIAVFLQNCPQCYITYLAALRLGLIIAPVDPMSKDLELEYALSDSGSTLIVVLDQLYSVVKNVKDKCKIMDVIVTSFSDYLPDKPELPLHPMMQIPKETFPNTYQFLELIGKYPPAPPKVDVKLDDNAWILYTGGTTGQPKGCLHTQYTFALGGTGRAQLTYNRASKGDVMLSSAPHTHVFGISDPIGSAFLEGVTIIPLVRWDPVTAMEAIEKYKVTLFGGAIPQYFSIINHSEVNRYDLTSLRMVIWAGFGATLDKETLERWYKITYCPMYSGGYNASEWFNYCTYGSGVPYRPACWGNMGWGLPCPGAEIKIVDFATGKEVPDGEAGEIITKTPAGLKEYWNKPKETKGSIVDGWIHTSDRGKLGEDGIIYFIAKEGDIIKVSGYTVAPKEVEMIGLKNPAIDKIALVGIPDPKKGQILKAFVTLQPGTKATASELEEWFKQNVSAIKRPIVEIRTELPTSLKGEILKKDLLAEELNKMGKG